MTKKRGTICSNIAKRENLLNEGVAHVFDQGADVGDVEGLGENGLSVDLEWERPKEEDLKIYTFHDELILANLCRICLMACSTVENRFDWSVSARPPMKSMLSLRIWRCVA